MTKSDDSSMSVGDNLLLIVATLSLGTVGRVNSELSSCSNSQMQAAWMSKADPVTSCQPRPTIISLSEAASGLGHSLSAPTHVEVARCGGSCPQSHSSMVSCVPASVASKMVPVMVTPVTVTSGVQEDVCTSIRVETHESCKCGCEVTPMDCNPKQVKTHYSWSADLKAPMSPGLCCPPVRL